MRTPRIAAIFTIVFFSAGLRGAEPITDKLLTQIKATGLEGNGNAEAASAWRELVKQGPGALFPILTAMDDASPVASNWLRTAAEAVFQDEKQAKKTLPVEKLEAFVKDTRHAPSPRRVAYELLVDVDPKASARLLPGMVNDPSVELRRDAIASAIETATPLIASKPDAAKQEFLRLFEASRDQDQAERIAKTLKDLGVTTDLATHFGVLNKWHLMGPFDSTKGVGFAAVYAPELKVDLIQTPEGKDKKPVKWVEQLSTDNYGAIDLNKALGNFKDSAAYAVATVESDKAQPVEIRLGSVTAVKVFLNGKELFTREEYHHGYRFDQYSCKATLKEGKNVVLVKVCQNNQTEPWAQDWKFQLRICDATGGAIPLKK